MGPDHLAEARSARAVADSVIDPTLDRVPDPGALGPELAPPNDGTPVRFVRWARPSPQWALIVVIGVWVVVAWRLGELRQDRFATFGFDLGIYGQAAWLVATGETPFMTVRGLDVWGHHGTVIFYLLAPIIWLGGGPTGLLVAQVVSQAAGAVGLYLLVRDTTIGARRGLGVAAAALLLLNPTQQWLVWEHFHPESFAVGPLLLGWWALRTERWGWFAACAIVAASCKEDIALAVAMMGVVIVISSPRSRRRIEVGLATFLLAVGWYFIVTQWLIPARNPAGAFYVQQFFGDFGSSTTEVLRNVAAHPMTFLRYITETRSTPPGTALRPTGHLEWYRMMLLSTLGVGLLRPKALLVAAPAVAVAMLTDTGHNWVRDYRYHYSAVVSACAVVAAVEVIVALQRRGSERVDWRRHAAAGLTVALLVVGVITTRHYGAFPSLFMTTSALSIGGAATSIALVRAVRRADRDNVVGAALVLAAIAIAIAGFHLEGKGLAALVGTAVVIVGVIVARRALGAATAFDAIVVGMVLAIAGGFVVGDRLHGPGPADRRTGYWPFHGDETMFDVLLGVDPARDDVTAAKRAIVKALPPDASVSAAYNVVPHLTERRFVYEFPNPWIPSNWGVQNENQADPADVEYLAFDEALLSSDPNDRTGVAVRRVLDHLLAEEFDVVVERDLGGRRIVLARRVQPPTCMPDSDGLLRSIVNDQRFASVGTGDRGTVCPVT